MVIIVGWLYAKTTGSTVVLYNICKMHRIPLGETVSLQRY